eukprot:CAMPEP_0178428024 /NCGR_PEP_ID=MMETSP0689_2-20121128/30057_1 /TAXON_ID=160604 /ORGANISM="Amphidinium massartii, Strain CS-259" /LENGTH=453 /DNA_ID=CAMNT_0020049769 /DNA_START=51 /DNA_END=1412 /DNA_ORIENTATION=+
MKVVRESKFRHVFAEASKERYDDIRLSSKSTESPGIRGNSKFFVFTWDSGGGGSLAVVPNTKLGRLPRDLPLITGHSGPVLDFEFNPFADNMLASASEDLTVKLWNIPDEGLKAHMKEPLASLEGHGKKVSFCHFNPCVDGILASSSFDMTCKIWSLQEQDEAMSVAVPDQVWSMKWSYFGNLLAATCKDKKMRILDPRAKDWVHESKSHDGVKATKVEWIGSTSSPTDPQRIVTTGFSQQAERQIGIWDLRKLNGDATEPLNMINMDQGTGALYPYFDEGTGMLYIWGKGDGNVRYFEVADEDPYLHFINHFGTTTPQKGYTFLPKRCCDVSKHEVMRALKLETNLVQPVSFRVPRKSEAFQEDLYPECPAGVPSCGPDDWLADPSKAQKPVLQSMKPGASAAGGAAAKRATTGGMVSVKELKMQLEGANARIKELEDENKKLKEEIAKLKG